MFSNIKKMTAAYTAVIFFIVLDRFLKAAAIAGVRAEMIDGIFKFDFTKNYYVAFSLPLYGVWLNAAIILIIILLMYFFAVNLRDGRSVMAAGLFAVIAAAAGNLYDRLAFGFVIDYFNLKYFTAFNLADALIAAGVIVLLLEARKKEAA